ncbi:LTXXQ domain-containing protein [Pseudomonas sp. M47T1]|uniref:LTXXQ domain-containing protein n=1 Tax=unclassified Pseudomonas TaxID=196821 RepID=UPI0002608094|nr:LTXXQ domain-containing protein [Pseudomonas sp. M47T1]EIK93693.1 LTXXQ domain-containing protein [Pseudomonas sp. M47T1]
MRKTLMALMFAAALPTVAMAAPEGGPGFGPGSDMGGMGGPGMHHERGPRDGFANLDLSPEQRQKIGQLMGEERKVDREVLHKYLEKLPAADQKAMKDEITAKHDKARADIRAVLNPTQQKQFDEMKKKQDARRAEWKEFQAWKAQKDQKAQ